MNGSKTPVPNRRIKLAYWGLCHVFGLLMITRRLLWNLDRWLAMPIELVHRPIRILGARYMDVLVNRKDVTHG
jgi:hypothetical protein